MLRTLALLVENNPGVLARISGLFSGKGYNLESLTVGVTTDPTISRITLICKGSDVEFEQIKKQLNRLIDVIKVMDLVVQPSVQKELALIKVWTKYTHRAEILQLSDVFGCRVIKVSVDSVIIEMSDSSERIDEFLTVLQSHSVVEIARSGLVAMEYGKSKSLPQDKLMA